MSVHDPLCPEALVAYPEVPSCCCALIARVRADERERVAQAIEGRAATHECGRAYRHAARIARGDAE